LEIINETVQNIYANIETNLTPETKCFVISHVIRDTGEELPIKEICEFVRKRKKEISPDDPEIFIIIDGAQALGNLPQIDFTEIGCDAYVGTPHKTMGSTPLGLGFINPDHPTIRKNLPQLNRLFWQDQQVILDGMFDPSLGIKPNVNDSIDRRDVFGFTHAIEHLSANGYASGNFEKINAKRRELKVHFKKNIQDITRESGLEITEVEQGTDFIYSFTVSGIDNRKFAQELSRQGIFVSYIDRTKLQSDDDHRVGNGVIRASFDVDNTKDEIDEFKDKITSALSIVIEEEFAAFEVQAEKAMVFKQPDNVVHLLSWMRERAKSPVVKVAMAASILLMVLSHKIAKDPTEIVLNEKFFQTELAELDRNQTRYNEYRSLFERDGFQHRIVEEMGMAEYMIEKYKLLTSLYDEKKINTLLADDASLHVAASFKYSNEEREQLESVFNQTGNKKIGKLLELLA
jgi:hypothetical protein